MATAAMALETVLSKRRKLLWESNEGEAEEESITRSTTPISNKESHRQQLLPPPCTYQGLYSSYRQEWEERRKNIPLHVDITDLASFWISTGSGLVACTSLGEVLLWRASAGAASSDATSNTSLQQRAKAHTQVKETNGQSLLEQTPVKRWNVSKLPLKSLQVLVEGSSNSMLILVGGEEGLFSISSSDASSITKWDSVTCRVRQTLVDEAADRVFVLAGEDAGQVQVYSLSSQTIIQSIDLGPSRASTMALAKMDDDQDVDVDVGNEKQTHIQGPSLTLLIGTTDSKLVIWNKPVGSSAGTTMETIRLYASDSDAGGGGGGSGANQIMLPFDITVTCIRSSQDDQWWTIAGACNKHHNHKSRSSTNGSGSSSNNSAGANGGVLATLHGPTRTLVACKETRETIQSIAITNHGSATVYTAANEGVVSVWESPYQLERRVRVWTNPASGHTITSIPLVGGGGGSTSTTSTTSAIAISGVGPHVDILQDSCRVQTLQTQEEESNRD
jgi:hypothetical protein